jgi:hypothetical protein
MFYPLGKQLDDMKYHSSVAFSTAEIKRPVGLFLIFVKIPGAFG